MTIHHTIVKGAAAKGVILTSDEDTVKARHAESGLVVILEHGEEATENDQAKEAWANVLEMRDYQNEHPAVALRHEDGDYVAYHRQSTQAGSKLADEIARDPELADLFESIFEVLAAEVEAETDETEDRGSVVPEKYKKLYAERGDPTHCGDWLAITINGICRVTDGKKEVTDLDRLEALANANDVAPARYGKLGVETNGWQGRFRMTVRNMLTPRIASKGFLFVPDGIGAGKEREIKAPREWCVEHAPKAKETGTKKAKGGEKDAGKKTSKKQAKKDAGEAGLAVAREAIASARERAKQHPELGRI